MKGRGLSGEKHSENWEWEKIFPRHSRDIFSGSAKQVANSSTIELLNIKLNTSNSCVLKGIKWWDFQFIAIAFLEHAGFMCFTVCYGEFIS